MERASDVLDIERSKRLAQLGAWDARQWRATDTLAYDGMEEVEFLYGDRRGNGFPANAVYFPRLGDLLERLGQEAFYSLEQDGATCRIECGGEYVRWMFVEGDALLPLVADALIAVLEGKGVG